MKPTTLLPQLWKHGVRNIELRTILPAASLTEALHAANVLWDYGFHVTVHSSVKSLQSAVEDVFISLTHILAHMRQRELVVTIHPIVSDNVAMLTALSDYITEHNYPVCIALENNRKLPDGTNGDSVALVLDAVMRA